MPLLNPPDILPEAMRFLLRAVLAHQGGRCTKAALLALVAPEGLAEAMRPLDSDKEDDSDGENTAASGRLIADRSLRGDCPFIRPAAAVTDLACSSS